MGKIVTNFSLLANFLHHLATGKKITAVIYITDKCNSSCPNCYYKKQLRTEDNVSLKEWETRFRDYYERGYRHVMLIGGEPAIRMDVLRLAGQVFPFVTVITNGIVKIPENINCRIHLSLDGPQAIHDKLRGEGSFGKAFENYTGDYRVAVYLTLGKTNYSGPENLGKFLWEAQDKFSGLFVNFHFPQTDDPKSYKYLLDEKELLEIRQVLLKEKKRGNFILNTKKTIISQTQPNANSTKCRLPQLLSVYSSRNKPLPKIHPKTDCNHCRFIFRYENKPWDILEWLRIRHMRRKILFN